MVNLLPESELAETLRSHSVVEAVLVVALKPVPDVFQVLLLTDTDLAKVNDGLVPLRDSGIQSLSLFDASVELLLRTDQAFKALVLEFELGFEAFDLVLEPCDPAFVLGVLPSLILCLDLSWCSVVRDSKPESLLSLPVLLPLDGGFLLSDMLPQAPRARVTVSMLRLSVL